MSGTHDERTRLNPTGLDQIRERLLRLRSWWSRRRLRALRWTVACGLLVLAAVLALLPDVRGSGPRAPVVLAAHDLAPGAVLGGADLRQVELPLTAVPSGALDDPAVARGRVLSGAARRGEPITDVRLADVALTSLATSRDDHVAVPIRLSDPAIAELLHPGRSVDVVTDSAADPAGQGAAVLAEQVPVLAIRPVQEDNDRGRLIVVGLAEEHAAAVAAASLNQAVTVTLR